MSLVPAYYHGEYSPDQLSLAVLLDPVAAHDILYDVAFLFGEVREVRHDVWPSVRRHGAQGSSNVLPPEPVRRGGATPHGG